MHKQVTQISGNHPANTSRCAKTVLVLGGHGFIGRYTVSALQRRGADIIIGTRGKKKGKPRLLNANYERAVVLHQKTTIGSWTETLEGVDVVINTVGILRERYGESFEAVHHLAVAALAHACKSQDIPLIHMSALGIDGKVHNTNTLSKLNGEKAIIASKCAGAIVRTSVVDAPDGYGSGWLHRVANWPVWLVPAGAKSLMSPIDANDAGEALATLALDRPLSRTTSLQEPTHTMACVEIGCGENFTLQTYLSKLRNQSRGQSSSQSSDQSSRPWLIIKVPQTVARLCAHVFDVLHITPYSIGHHELLEHDNVPKNNQLPALLGKTPTPIGSQTLHTTSEPVTTINPGVRKQTI